MKTLIEITIIIGMAIYGLGIVGILWYSIFKKQWWLFFITTFTIFFILMNVEHIINLI